MAREDAIAVEGRVVGAVGRAVYRVELPNGHRVLAHWKGRARREATVLTPGARVRLEMSPFDLSVGAMVWNENET